MAQFAREKTGKVELCAGSLFSVLGSVLDHRFLLRSGSGFHGWRFGVLGTGFRSVSLLGRGMTCFCNHRDLSGSFMRIGGGIVFSSGVHFLGDLCWRGDETHLDDGIRLWPRCML